jgi:hypothetical protein
MFMLVRLQVRVAMLLPVLVPHLVHQSFPAHRLPRCGDQQDQQFVLLRAQHDLQVTDPGPAGPLVEPD